MKRFYNLFPYPGRPLLVMPNRVLMGLSHMGFARLLAAQELAKARKFWKTFHSSEHRKFASLTRKREGIKYLDAFLHNCYRKSCPKVLLAGCGTDEPVLHLSLHPSALIDAVDLSWHSLLRARIKTWIFRLTHPCHLVFFPLLRLKFFCSAVEDFLEKAEQKYDHIVCFGVLHHQQNPRRFLGKMAEALKPGGTLRIMIYTASGRQLERTSQRLIGFQQRPFSPLLALKRVFLLRIWLWWKRFSKHSGIAARFAYLSGSNSRIADALLHPSDPGLDPGIVGEWLLEAQLEMKYCCAKSDEKGWIVGIENPAETWQEILHQEKTNGLVSNIEFIAAKIDAKQGNR